MKKNVRQMVRGAVIAGLYVVLTHLQNIMLPGSATMAIQFRASEALCVLAFFTPAAIPGLAVGCLLFNLTFAASLPLDFLVGTLATVLATGSMRLLRKVRNNRPQSGIVGEAKRRANVLGVYQVENPEMVLGKRILLLDDVITTGSTAGECARMLLIAGAKEIYCGAVAVARHRANNKVR